MNYIILNNKKSTEIKGLMICALPPISKPAKRINQEEIDGRDGDIITELGYKAYDKTIEIALTYNYNVDEIITYFDSEGIVIFSNEPDKYYKYKIVNKIDYEKLIRFKTAKVTMHVQPFKYLVNEEKGGFENGIVTVTGNSIHLTDSSNSSCNIAPLGASKQETREGYNLVSEYSPHYTSNCTLSNNVFTSSTVSGYGNVRPRFTEITLPANKKHYISCDIKLVSGTSGNLNSIQGYGTSGLIAGTQVENPALSNTYQRYVFEITPTTEYAISGFLIQLNNSTVDAVVDITNLMVSTENVPYEQYGASPSIEFEAPIESVGDNINLIDIDSLIEGYVKDGGECSTTSQYGEMRSGFLKVKPNTQYTFKIHETSGKEVSWMGIGEYSSNEISSYILRNVYSPSKYVENASYTITTSNTTQYVIVSSRNLIGATKIKFEEGQPTPYSPYGQGSIEIYNGNKNFLNLENMTTQTKNGVTLTKNNDGSYTLNGTSTAPTEIKIPINLLLKKGTYTHSTHNEYKGGLFISFNNLNYTMIGENFMASKTFTIEENTKYTTYYIWIASGVTFNNYVVYPMLEYGSSVREYIPHQSQTQALYTQQPFRAIGDVRDKFVKVDGVWYEEHYIKLDSLSELAQQGGGYIVSAAYASDTYFCGFLKSGVPDFKKNSNTVIMCDKLPIGLYSNITDKECINNSYQLNIRILASRLSENSADGLTEYITKNPIFVQYVLVEPILIPCTPEQVEVLESFNTYKNVTNISSDSIGELEVTYTKNGETIVNNLGNVNAKPVFTIYGEGDIEVYLNGYQIFNIELGEEGYITIDVDKMEAYKDTLATLKNRLVTGNYDNFILESGKNVIDFIGRVSKFEISNYSRWI